MGRLRDLIESLLIRFRNFVLKNDMNEMCICLILLLCITTLFSTIGATPYSIICGREAQNPIDLFVTKPAGDARLKLGENAQNLNERLYVIHREAQITMGTEQRRQREYFKKSTWRSV